MKNTIECKNVAKLFKGDGIETYALRDVNLTLTEGEFISIIGPSGSGKSTLLSLLGTLDLPSSGEIMYGNQATNKLNNKHMADFRFENIGFVFQQFHLIPTLTALENIMAPLFGRRVTYDKKQRGEDLLKMVGLSDKRNSLPSQLSGGQQQRVAIARALVHDNTPSTGEVVGSSEEGTKGNLIPDSNMENKDLNASEKENKTKNKMISELQENAYRSFALGDGTDENEVLKFGNLLEPPVGVVASNEKNQLISIPVTIDIPDETGGTVTYKPQGYKLIDETGKEYSVLVMNITERGNWNKGFSLRFPSKTSVVLTYEVPKSEKKFVLVAKGDYIAGTFVVEIDLKKVNKKSAD